MDIGESKPVIDWIMSYLGGLSGYTYIESLQLSTIRVKSVVVKVGKLFGYRIDIGHGGRYKADGIYKARAKRRASQEQKRKDPSSTFSAHNPGPLLHRDQTRLARLLLVTLFIDEGDNAD
jgi:hypothetical protein